MPNNDYPKLRKCPFCGGKGELRRSVECWGHGMYIPEHYVRCTECGARVEPKAEYGQKEAECITKCTEAWNRRADNEQRAD